MIKLILAVCLLVGLAAAENGKCTMDWNSTTTFDMKEYPVTLDDSCWYVALLKPQTRESSRDISVLVRNFMGRKKEVKVVFGNDNVLRMKPSSTSQRADVYLNGQRVDISPGQTARTQARRGMSMLEMDVDYNGAVLLSIPLYNIDIGYDTTSIIIDVDKNFRGAVRGLCGTFDGSKGTDFKTRNNCVVSSPADFVSTWTVSDETCQSTQSRGSIIANPRDCSEGMNDLQPQQQRTPNPYVSTGDYVYLLNQRYQYSLYALTAGNLYTVTHNSNPTDPSNQYWHILEIQGGYVLFENGKLGKALYADDAGRLLTEYMDSSKHSQHWKIIPSRTEGYVYLENRANQRILDSGDKISCSESTSGECSEAHAYPRYLGTDHHHWKILK